MASFETLQVGYYKNYNQLEVYFKARNNNLRKYVSVKIAEMAKDPTFWNFHMQGDFSKMVALYDELSNNYNVVVFYIDTSYLKQFLSTEQQKNFIKRLSYGLISKDEARYQFN